MCGWCRPLAVCTLQLIESYQLFRWPGCLAFLLLMVSAMLVLACDYCEPINFTGPGSEYVSKLFIILCACACRNGGTHPACWPIVTLPKYPATLPNPFPVYEQCAGRLLSSLRTSSTSVIMVTAPAPPLPSLMAFGNRVSATTWRFFARDYAIASWLPSHWSLTEGRRQPIRTQICRGGC
jgi:hypothetical protein